ncbi:DMT family transporter [Pseudonocardia endophytica]|uniref:DMT family transporter n=1 Tax=Pseudonocardia endophytica TaxID=401976 RepID=UPI001404F889|nr:DMT family transporter [Pseudonocardia endophytica]
MTSPMRSSARTLLAGAATLASTGVLVRLADVGAATASFWRCIIALAVLLPLAAWEARRFGTPGARQIGWGLAGGALLGADFLLWTQSVLDAGSGIANVVLNVQVIAFPLIALAVAGTVVPRRQVIAAPVLLAGIALAGGALGGDTTMPSPVRGAALGAAAGLAYAGYLYLSRSSARAARGHVVTPVAAATVAAALTTGIVGGATQGIAVDLPLASWFWLAVLALAGQVVAWVLITRGSAGLPPGTSAALLLVQPVLAVLLGAVVMGERPTVWQLAGCVLVVLTVAATTMGGSRRDAAPDEEPEPVASGRPATS